jgi:hypothetical protein
MLYSQGSKYWRRFCLAEGLAVSRRELISLNIGIVNSGWSWESCLDRYNWDLLYVVDNRTSRVDLSLPPLKLSILPTTKIIII